MLRDRGQIGRSAYTGFRHSLEVWPAVPHLPHVSKARGLHIAGEVSDGFQIAVAAALAEPAIASFPPLCPAVLQSVQKFEQLPLLVRCVAETQCVQIVGKRSSSLLPRRCRKSCTHAADDSSEHSFVIAAGMLRVLKIHLVERQMAHALPASVVEVEDLWASFGHIFTAPH